jgi:archaellum component FlaF (FlaF/FlaG flagellin family)
MKFAMYILIPVLEASLILSACSDLPRNLTPAPAAPVVGTEPTPLPAAVSPAPAAQTEQSVGAAPAVPAAPATGFEVIQTAPPAKQNDFQVSNLQIVPNTIRIFNSANVSVTVTNNGTTAGSSTAVLNVQTDGLEGPATITPPSQTVFLAPGESTTVSFSVELMGNGAHTVTIDGLSDKLTVDSSI